MHICHPTPSEMSFFSQSAFRNSIPFQKVHYFVLPFPPTFPTHPRKVFFLKHDSTFLIPLHMFIAHFNWLMVQQQSNKILISCRLHYFVLILFGAPIMFLFSTVYVFRPSGHPCSNFWSSYFYCLTVWNLILLAVDTTQSEKSFLYDPWQHVFIISDNNSPFF